MIVAGSGAASAAGGVGREAAARVLVELYVERCDVAGALARVGRPTGAMAEACMAKGRELDEACEEFRRRFYPRRHRVVSAGYSVMVVSRAARSVDVVLDLSDCPVVGGGVG